MCSLNVSPVLFQLYGGVVRETCFATAYPTRAQELLRINWALVRIRFIENQPTTHTSKTNSLFFCWMQFFSRVPRFQAECWLKFNICLVNRLYNCPWLSYQGGLFEICSPCECTSLSPRLPMRVLGSVGQCLPQWIHWLRSWFFPMVHGKHLEIRPWDTISFWAVFGLSQMMAQSLKEFHFRWIDQTLNLH